MTPKYLSLLFEALKETKTKIKHLCLSRNKFGDKIIDDLGQYIKANPDLENLDIGSNNLTEKGVEILSEHLIGNTALKQLSLRSNDNISNAATPFLMEIAKNSCITSMDLNFTNLYEEDIDEINEALSIPVDKREISVNSKSKSASKTSIFPSAST